MATALITLALLAMARVHPARAQAPTPEPPGPPAGAAMPTVEQILQAVNSARLSIGHPALILDPILMAYAQEGADRAANDLPAREGGAVSNVIAMGYGYPETSETIFCTYNSATVMQESAGEVVANFGSVGERVVNNVFYRHAGIGIARGVGDWEGYVMLHLLGCYTADRLYKPGQTAVPGQPTAAVVPGVIYPVETAQPGADGRLFHEVLPGQSLWAIATAYNTHIAEILKLNGFPAGVQTIYSGQKLLIPTLAGIPAAMAASPAPPAADAAPGVNGEAPIPAPAAAGTAPVSKTGAQTGGFTRNAILVVVAIGGLALLGVSVLKRE